MAENSVNEADAPAEEESQTSVVDEANSKPPLKISFADWKKSRDAIQAEFEPTRRNGRQPQKNDNNNKQQQSGNKNNFNNNNNFGANNRGNGMPFPMMNMGFGNFGPGPGAGPCGPPPMMPPGNNMGNMGPGPGPGPGPRNYRPMQPPPFWQDMMSPQLRTPPIQPPMPKCPSLWNLVPKEKDNQRQSSNNNSNNNNNRKQQYQPNKKYKSSNNNNSNNNNSNNNNTNKSSTDAALMPPPPAPGSSSNNNNANTATNGVKKKKGGTYVQIDGKWIQRPEAPLPLEEAPPGTKEDRQRQWREYRQAMKPFKNREFHNWKRTVQRLSKLPRNQLDERQLERLQKAEEYIGAHKAMLTIKHAEHWVPQGNQKSEATTAAPGQVFVRKQPVVSTWNRKDNQQTFQQTAAPPAVRKQTFGTGRAIKGGAAGELSCLPALPTTAPPPPPPPPPPPIGQFPDMSCPPLPGGYLGYNSQVYGQEGGNNHGGSPFYANYNSSFVKGGTLLPP